MSDVMTPLQQNSGTEEPESRVVLVTGATGGLGSEICKSLTTMGITTIISGRNMASLEALYDELDDIGTAEPAMYPIDLAGATDAEFRQMGSTLASEFQRLDGIAHCASDLGVSTPLENYPAEKWQAVMQTNANGPFMLTRACLPLMMKTQFASVTFAIDQRDSAFWGAYGVSKAAVTSLMTILADEVEGFKDENNHSKVAVNAVHPGRMRTRMRAVAFSGELPEESPPPATRVDGFLKVLLRIDPAMTGHITYLDQADAPRQPATLK